MLRTKGPVETSAVPLCWEFGDHMAIKGSHCRGWARQGWGSQAKCSNFRDCSQALCSSPCSLNPSAMRGWRALSTSRKHCQKKAFSVLLCRCNLVKKTKKASPPAKEQALTVTALELPPTLPALQGMGTELVPHVPALCTTQSQALRPV